VSLVSGNEYGGDATQDDLLQCAAAYVQVNDPELASENADSVTTFMLRITAEQRPYQSNPYNELGRSAALFMQTSPAKTAKVIRPGWANELFGGDLSQYVGIGFLVHTVALHNAGRFSTHWFDLPALEPITAVIPADVIRSHPGDLVTGNGRRSVTPGTVGPGGRPVQFTRGEPRRVHPHDDVVLRSVRVGHLRELKPIGAGSAITHDDRSHVSHRTFGRALEGGVALDESVPLVLPATITPQG
jgi:hypothetical protein